MPAKKKIEKKSPFNSIVILIVLFLASLFLLSQLQGGKKISSRLSDFFSPARHLAAGSLALEEAINEVLVDAGVADSDIVTASTQEKITDGYSWYYFEKQLKLPLHINIKKLQAKLRDLVLAKKGTIFEEKLEEKEQESVLHFKAGLGQQVTQHLIIGQLLASAEASTAYQVALIIDDVGNNQDIRLLDKVGVPLTVAILPQLNFSEFSAGYASEKGYTSMLHLPLEPADGSKNPGPGLIRVGMSEEEVLAILDKDLASVPGVIGVNGHMGSLATTSKSIMRIILKELKKRGLIYVDSMVVKNSVGPELALELGLVSYKRDVFIDNIDEVNYVKKQLRELLQLALKNGQAVGIGHIYHESTRTAIEQMLPEFTANSVSFVPITALKPLRRRQLADNGS